MGRSDAGGHLRMQPVSEASGLNPARQMHRKLPCVFMQSPLGQNPGTCWHSSISARQTAQSHEGRASLLGGQYPEHHTFPLVLLYGYAQYSQCFSTVIQQKLTHTYILTNTQVQSHTCILSLFLSPSHTHKKKPQNHTITHTHTHTRARTHTDMHNLNHVHTHAHKHTQTHKHTKAH